MPLFYFRNDDVNVLEDELGFRIVNSHFNHRLSRRVMYAVGHAIRAGQGFRRG